MYEVYEMNMLPSKFATHGDFIVKHREWHDAQAFMKDIEIQSRGLGGQPEEPKMVRLYKYAELTLSAPCEELLLKYGYINEADITYNHANTLTPRQMEIVDLYVKEAIQQFKSELYNANYGKIKIIF